MFRLTGRDRFEAAPLGDSRSVDRGDSVIAMGNPFTLAEDYSPTVTTGIVTGIHRYQGESETLVYTDAIQTDAAINPGNSGGPLFDSEGRVIGINGRISAEMHKYARGRYNVGLGYAITINQIKRFIPSLRAGLLAKHGTLLATVVDRGEEIVFNDLYEDAPAWNAGVRVGNKLVRFGGVEIGSANQFLSLLGTYPENWPVAISFESFGRVRHKVVRLEGVTPPMRADFVVDGEVNRRAVERTLSGFREAVVGAGAAVPEAWTWTVERDDPDGSSRTYRLRDDGGPVIERVELDAEGEASRRLALDVRTGRWTEGEEDYAASEAEALYYRAMRVVRGLPAGVSADAALTQELFHAGSDAITEIDADGNITRERPLEAIEMEFSDDVALHVAFEVDTHLPARVVATDAAADFEVEIRLDDYREAGGVVWPHRAVLDSPGVSFTERTIDLTVSE
jgi:hypothetical protein